MKAIRWGLVRVLGAILFINGLAKGGLPILLILLLPSGDRWIQHQNGFVWWGIAIGFALALGVPFLYFYSKE
jgi:hypothetical protein